MQHASIEGANYSAKTVGFALELYAQPTGVALMPKSLWQSKTFWVNALTAAAAALTALAGSEFVASYPRAVTAIGAVLAIVNIGLRIITDQPIKL